MQKFYIYRNNKRNIILIVIFFLGTVLAIVNALKNKNEINILTFVQPLIFLILVFIVLKRSKYFVSLDSEKVILNLPKHRKTSILKKDIINIKIELFSIDFESKNGGKFSIDLNESSSQTKDGLKEVFNISKIKK
jgi:hypothetical protein